MVGCGKHVDWDSRNWGYYTPSRVCWNIAWEEEIQRYGRTEICGRWYTSDSTYGQIEPNVNQFFCRECILRMGVRW